MSPMPSGTNAFDRVKELHAVISDEAAALWIKRDDVVRLLNVVDSIKAQAAFHGMDSLTVGVQKALKALDDEVKG